LLILIQKWHNILINFAVNLPNNNRFINIIVVINYLIKMRYIIPINLINAISVAKYFIKYVFKLHRFFNLIISNYKNQFVLDFWKALYKQLGI